MANCGHQSDHSLKWNIQYRTLWVTDMDCSTMLPKHRVDMLILTGSGPGIFQIINEIFVWVLNLAKKDIPITENF
jgi:hypothetical protein